MQQHLLMVWNPLLEPRTIQVHVESLRRTTTDSYVWWGRIYAGTKELTAATVQEKWQYVFDINKRARRSQSPLVMFVTDFTSLHALQIDHVQPGPTWPNDARDRMPEYYREGDLPAALWFRVRDVRALSHYQLHTLEHFRSTIGTVHNPDPGATQYPFDPYASYRFDYPIVINPPSSENLFDKDALKQRSPTATRYADLPETIFPPDVQVMLDTLEAELHYLWNDLRANSRIFLACGRLVEQRNATQDSFDFSSAVCEIAKAVEEELIRGLATGLLTLPDRTLPRDIRTDIQRSLAGNHTRGLGPVTALLKRVDGTKELGSFKELMRPGGPWLQWLESFTTIRNRALHNQVVSHREFQDIWAGVVSPEKPVGLKPIIETHAEIRSIALESRE